MSLRLALLAVPVIAAVTVAAGAQSRVTKEAVPGVTNFTRLETTVACGGVITPSAVAELEQRGFKSIFDLQLPDEKGADVNGEAAAAKAAGITFVHVPFTPARPDNASVDKFVQEISKPANEPAFIHCAGGNRAAGFWMIKRVLVDKWDIPRAQAEAESLGLSSSQMKQFAVAYIQAHTH
ncbi:MAG TPA: sulfur transferase domain-containing protein [Vicinamibacterales bacterium]|jgi:uncharacterized protein (TIGR01244 family)|nr:sulfur transferase domain-containing protein [Vicinamibacterales bacterium]